jgi:Activator of Hsp90 ATPase homolog 1-like protein
MNTSFRTTFPVEQTPQEAFDAICDVRSWWSGQIEGGSDTVGDEFGYTVPGVHFSRQRITELEPARRVAWLVVDSRLDYLDDPQEWNGTTITFDLVAQGAGTEVTFTHQGLVPEVECYDQCTSAWSSWVLPDLRRRIAQGVGAEPTPL